MGKKNIKCGIHTEIFYTFVLIAFDTQNFDRARLFAQNVQDEVYFLIIVVFRITLQS